MSIFRFSVGSDAKSMAVPCVFAIGVVCWANCEYHTVPLKIYLSKIVNIESSKVDVEVYFSKRLHIRDVPSKV